MEALITQIAGHANGIVAYAAIFGVLVACGLGVPLPEDFSLATGGFIAHRGAAHLWIMMIVGFAGIIAGDSIIYLAGRRVGAKVGTKQTGFFARIVTPEKRAKVEELFHRHGQKIVMAARFLPGVRAVTFFTAGSAGMKYWRFILWDGLAALVSAPLLVFVGFFFGDELDLVIHKVRHGQVRVIAVILLLGLAYFFYARWRAKRERDRANAAAKASGGADPASGASPQMSHPSPAPASAPLAAASPAAPAPGGTEPART